MLVTDSPEIESVAVIVITLVVPTKVGSDELIIISLDQLNHGSDGDTDQVILVAIPAGFVTIEGIIRRKGVPI